MRRLPERRPELPAEVRGGEAGGPREVGDVERLRVARVGEVLRAEEVPGGRGVRHDRKYAPTARAIRWVLPPPPAGR